MPEGKGILKHRVLNIFLLYKIFFTTHFFTVGYLSSIFSKSLVSPLIHLLPSCLNPLQHFDSNEVLYTVRTDLDDLKASL